MLWTYRLLCYWRAFDIDGLVKLCTWVYSVHFHALKGDLSCTFWTDSATCNSTVALISVCFIFTELSIGLIWVIKVIQLSVHRVSCDICQFSLLLLVTAIWGMHRRIAWQLAVVAQGILKSLQLSTGVGIWQPSLLKPCPQSTLSTPNSATNCRRFQCGQGWRRHAGSLTDGICALSTALRMIHSYDYHCCLEAFSRQAKPCVSSVEARETISPVFREVRDIPPETIAPRTSTPIVLGGSELAGAREVKHQQNEFEFRPVTLAYMYIPRASTVLSLVHAGDYSHRERRQSGNNFVAENDDKLLPFSATIFASVDEALACALAHTQIG